MKTTLPRCRCARLPISGHDIAIAASVNRAEAADASYILDALERGAVNAGSRLTEQSCHAATAALEIPEVVDALPPIVRPGVGDAASGVLTGATVIVQNQIPLAYVMVPL